MESERLDCEATSSRHSGIEAFRGSQVHIQAQAFRAFVHAGLQAELDYAPKMPLGNLPMLHLIVRIL